MRWIGLWDQHESRFDPDGLGGQASSRPDTGALLTQGSIVVETTLSQGRRPQTLLTYTSGGAWSVQLSLRFVPGGGIALILDHAGSLSHATVRHPSTERLQTLRITYAWDAPAQWGQLAVEDVETGRFSLTSVAAPPPLRMSDLKALIEPTETRFVTPDASFLAVASEVAPVGPMPSLAARTPILTPDGEKPIATLNRGDTVCTDHGVIVPVLHRVAHTVPARGSFAPIRLRAPYFGLTQDIVVSPCQSLKITGSEVEYLFGSEAVLASAGHFRGHKAAAVEAGPVITYHQLILPQHAALVAAGAPLNSLSIGRLRRKKDLFGATLLSRYDRSRLPEHVASVFPALRQYDALVLADQRSA